jgi:predicted nucleic acid-binding protein
LKRVVVDASVAAKWALPNAQEPLTDEARDVLQVPDLFWAEVGAVLSKALRQNRIGEQAARDALQDLLLHNFPSIRSRALIADATKIAISYRRTVYDCLYVALAVRAKAELITADERLVNALGSRFPVRWLGGWTGI